MKIKNFYKILLMLFCYAAFLVLLLLFQLLTLKEFLLLLIPPVFVSFIFRYSFIRILDDIRVENQVRRHFKVLTHFIEDLFAQRDIGINRIRYIIRYVDHFNGDFLMYFGFNRELTTENSVQNFYFLNGKYRINFKVAGGSSLFIHHYSKTINHAEIHVDRDESRRIYNQLISEIKLYNKAEYNITF